ncbi:MAG TPA: hypothetical protein VLG50_01185 [Candidatus Saccharimonadales bacterium]|nr:hypothetical protein [Candidatus Saccharimonadales bacterium]
MSDENGIYITKKQASVSAAVFIVLSLLIFIGGYFWGKQSVIDGFSQKACQESFNDQVDYLLTMQSFAEKNGGTPVSEEDVTTKSTEPIKAQSEKTEVPKAASTTQELEVQPVIKEIAQSVKVSKKPYVTQQPDSNQTYRAQLVGFGKRGSAVQFQNRLKKYNIDVDIQQKTSKSASGKVTRTWFQVVTKSYDSKQELQNLIDKILSLEKIKRSDIKIV